MDLSITLCYALFILLYFCLTAWSFWDRVLLYSPCYTRTHSIAQNGLHFKPWVSYIPGRPTTDKSPCFLCILHHKNPTGSQEGTLILVFPLKRLYSALFSLNFQGISLWAKHLMNVLLANTCDVLKFKVWLSLRNTEQQRAWEWFDYFDQSRLRKMFLGYSIFRLRL